MRRIAIVVAAVAILTVAFLLYRHGGSRAAAAAPSPPVPVTVDRARLQDLPVWLSGVGSVQPINVVDVKVRVDGQLERLAFTEGTDVRRGDLLAQLDPRPFQAQLELATANLGKDRAQLGDAQTNLARFTKLASIGAAPGQNVDTLRAQVAQLEAAMQADRALIDSARLDLDFTTVRAPFDGRVGLQLVHVGSIVHASDPGGLVTLTQMVPIAVEFSLPQDQLAALRAAPGKPVVTAFTRDGVRSLDQGELAAIDSQIDATTGQVKLKAVFANAQRALWPGQFVVVRVLVRTDHQVMVVPAQAVLQGQHGPYVYVVRAGATVEARPVAIGASVDGVTAVRSGITATDTIVVEGQVRIAPGTKVAVTVAGQGASS